ncbi:hypothetical protein TNCV_1788211 [Trichonephila clavipes]|nr:hypothetical protein TNCV_1788211 [Trichonephila clavipes]
MEIGGVAIYRKGVQPVSQAMATFIHSLREISPSLFVLSPVWYSRPATGVLLAPCHDEFRGPRSHYVRQVALEAATQQTLKPSSLNTVDPRSPIKLPLLLQI